MNSIIDYIGSMIIGGTVFIMMLGYYLNIGSTATSQVLSTSTQEDVTSITEIIEHDLRKAGYGITDSIAFPIADSNRIAIRGDLDDNGSIDTVQYWLSATPMPGTTNPQARILYRTGGGMTVRLTPNVVTRFALGYYDQSGNPTTVKKNIRAIHLALNLENKIVVENGAAGQYWERIIKPQNLR